MTEEQWLACEEPESLIRYLSGGLNMVRTKVGRRKLRLFACGCCRFVWDLILDEPCRRAVDATEMFADGAIGKELHATAREEAALAAQRRWQTFWDTSRFDMTAHTTILWRAARAVELAADTKPGLAVVAGPIIAKDVSPRGQKGEKARQIALIRDLVGNPFRPVAFDPAWRTDTAVSLARGMYDSRDFGAMPILADALQDAGCENAQVLRHCREPGPHVRGCWVCDLVLGKA